MSPPRNPPPTYRPMTAADLPAAHGLSTQLNWPHRLGDWAFLLQVGTGFVAADGERLVGSAFTCAQGNFASIGLVIVSDDYQGQGIGRRLMEMALAACASRTPVLNATPAGASLYQSQGFVEYGRVQQHQGKAFIAELPSLARNETCRTLGPADDADVLELANAGSGLDRRNVLHYLDNERAVGIERDGRLCGVALLRPFGRGHCIGPVVAQTVDQARHLIAVLLKQMPGAFVRIDIPMPCALSHWLDEIGMRSVDTVVQMARGTPPRPRDGALSFALITQAIG